MIQIISRSRAKQLCFLGVVVLAVLIAEIDCKDHKKPEHSTKGNPCIARFESTGEPLYYTCPRPNESEKKSYCCYLDKCCDYKEFQKQTEQQFKASQGYYGYIAKGAIGGALKALLWIVFIIIALIVGCCCLTFFLCRRKRLFQGGIFNTPLPAQPPGPSPYAPPANPYMAYQWPPETGPATGAPGAPAHGGPSGPVPPPAYPAPSYPPYPSNTRVPQPPFNPNFK